MPQAFLESALRHALLDLALDAIMSIKSRVTRAIPSGPQQSHKTVAASLINRKLHGAWDASQLSTIYTIMVLVGCFLRLLSAHLSFTIRLHLDKDSEALQIHLDGPNQIIRRATVDRSPGNRSVSPTACAAVILLILIHAALTSYLPCYIDPCHCSP